MKKCFLNYILFSLLLLTSYSFKAGAQNIQVNSKIDQPTIRIGDQTKLRLIVHQPVKEHVNFPKLTDTLTGKVQIVTSAKPDTVVDKDDKNNIVISQIYIITSFDAGTYNIPAFSFGTSKGVLTTSPITLQVETVKVDTTKAIYDIKQPITVQYTWLDWLKDNWLWVLIPILVIALIIGAIWYWRKKPKVVAEVKIVKTVVPPHVIAINKLNELRDKKLWQDEQAKLYYIELSDIIREYLEKRYLIKTHEKTTDEIFVGLRNMSITAENRKLLNQLLVLSDLVKFAKEKPLPDENEQSMQNAMNFVLNTKQEERPQSVEGGNENV